MRRSAGAHTILPMRIQFEHSYSALAPRIYARVGPTPVANPQLVVFNRCLAKELGLDPDVIERQAAVMLSGNQLPDDSNPIAMAYAGHQFGSFVPQLGDGRAILLGELRGRDGVLRDIQLKGAGLTPGISEMVPHACAMLRNGGLFSRAYSQRI